MTLSGINAISTKTQCIINSKVAMKRISFFGTIALCTGSVLFIGCSPEKQEDSAELAQDKNLENFGTRDGEKDADFVVTTVEGSYAGIKFAQLALNKSSNTDLKGIAERIEKDNSRILNDLKDLSYKKGIAIPVEESKNTKKDIQDLQKEEQQEFNEDWLELLTDQHKRVIKNFESTGEKTQDTELKSWINSTLPALRSRLDSLTACQDKLRQTDTALN
jgi:putative membrane protein